MAQAHACRVVDHSRCLQQARRRWAHGVRANACRALLGRVLVLLVPAALLPAGRVPAALLLGGSSYCGLLFRGSLHRRSMADLEAGQKEITRPA
jgi:hypothetical protein